MSKLIDRRREPEAQAAAGDYLKVLIPVQKGAYDGPCEGIWVAVNEGNAEEGIGTIDNGLILCRWARCGDRVAYKELKAGTIAFVTHKVVQ